MATVSMASSETAFGNLALQLSPAFRSVHERALRERQLHKQPSDQQTLSELARSDEFSDDESDGVDSDDDDNANADDDDDYECADTFEDRKPAAPSAIGMTPRRHSPYHRAQSAAAAVAAAAAAAETIDLDDDDLVDVKDTMYVPYRAPPRTDRSPRMDRFQQRRGALSRRQQQQQQQQQHSSHDAAPSPKSDDWTLVDKSPTFERLTRRSSASTAADVTNNWFQH